MDIRVNDLLIMKKVHPGCGNDKMRVIRTGMDFKLKCEKCGHVFMIPRIKCEKNIKTVIHDD